MDVTIVDPISQQTVTTNKVNPPGVPLSQAYPAARREQTVVDVSPALNMAAFAAALAFCMLAFSVMAVKNGITLITCRRPGG